MDKLRHFLNTPPGKVSIALLFAGALLLIWWQYNHAMGDGGVSDMSRGQIFMDASTGKPFTHTLGAGDTIPIKAPSGGATGYPAELCFWTPDGKPRTEPVPVLMNEYKNVKGPTFCPDCNRLVRMRNPTPAESDAPPPTQSEWEARGRK